MVFTSKTCNREVYWDKKANRDDDGNITRFYSDDDELKRKCGIKYLEITETRRGLTIVWVGCQSKIFKALMMLFRPKFLVDNKMPASLKEYHDTKRKSKYQIGFKRIELFLALERKGLRRGENSKVVKSLIKVMNKLNSPHKLIKLNPDISQDYKTFHYLAADLLGKIGDMLLLNAPF